MTVYDYQCLKSYDIRQCDGCCSEQGVFMKNTSKLHCAVVLKKKKPTYIVYWPSIWQHIYLEPERGCLNVIFSRHVSRVLHQLTFHVTATKPSDLCFCFHRCSGRIPLIFTSTMPTHTSTWVRLMVTVSSEHFLRRKNSTLTIAFRPSSLGQSPW